MNVLENFKDLFIDVWQDGVSGVNISEIIIALAIFTFFLFLRGVFSKYVVKKLESYVSKSTNSFDNSLVNSMEGPAKFFPIVLGFFVSTSYLTVDSGMVDTINRSLITILIFWTFHQVVGPFSSVIKSAGGLISRDLINWIIKATKILILILGFAAVLDLWGIKIGPIIAGLGLFGVAVALGAQDLFKNLISGIMILLEKRFQIGDVINVPGHTEGTVEHIGFRSTLIRKFDSTPITIPNYIFAEAPILNYTNRNYRRINWTIGLEYNSTLDQIKKLTEMISTYFKDNEDFMVNDSYKSFVRIEKFNDSSIDILVICFTSTNDWDKYLEIKEELAMKIKDSVEKIGLNFAFPSQSIYIEKTQNS